MILALIVEAVSDAYCVVPDGGLPPRQVIEIEWMAGKGGHVVYWLHETIHAGGLVMRLFR